MIFKDFRQKKTTDKEAVMSWQMKFYIAVNVVALVWCAVLAREIVKEISRERARRRTSLAVLLSISGSLEVAR